MRNSGDRSRPVVLKRTRCREHKVCNILVLNTPPQAQNTTEVGLHAQFNFNFLVHFMQYSDKNTLRALILLLFLTGMTLNVLPGDPIRPGGPGGPGWPSDPMAGGPGGPRAPGIPDIPGSPGQSKHKDHFQSDHKVSTWAGSLNHCTIIFFLLHARVS